jgi:hypothetical protein
MSRLNYGRYRPGRWGDDIPVSPSEHRALRAEALAIWFVLLVLALCIFAEPFTAWVQEVLRWGM